MFKLLGKQQYFYEAFSGVTERRAENRGTAGQGCGSEEEEGRGSGCRAREKNRAIWGYLRTLKSLTEDPEIIFSHAEALAKLKGKGALGKFREFRKSPGSRSLSTAMEWMEKNLISQEK